MRATVRHLAPAATLLVLGALAGCAPTESASSTTTSSPSASGSSAPASTSVTPSMNDTALPASGLGADCAPGALKLHTTGKFTFATDNPVYEPWFVDNKPASGKGFESAVAYAVAERLGFAQADVVWTQATFNSAIAPGPKPYDADINEVSITADRAKSIDFSTGYYDVTQALVTVKGNKLAKATSIADLKGAKLGAQVGTTSYATITDVIQPTAKPAVFNSNDDAKLALANGQIDGLVLDLPTALFEGSGADDALKAGALVGQFANGSGTPEQFGLVLDLKSPLTACVSKAVDSLRADGTLKKLEAQWLTASAGAPILK